MLPIDPDNIFSHNILENGHSIISQNDKNQNCNHQFDKTSSQDSSDTDSDNSIITTFTPTTIKDHDQKIIIEEIGKKKKFPRFAEIVKTGEFEPERHFYPRVLNATIHPLVASFFQLGNERIIARYTHLNPRVSLNALTNLLSRYKPKHFRWAGTDLFNVTTVNGQRQMIIVETNSCPSGQKSMPLLSETDEYGGYRVVIESAFKEAVEKADPSLGDLAVICDKNLMETSGYATALAEVMQERVWFVQYYDDDEDPPVKWIDRVIGEIPLKDLGLKIQTDGVGFLNDVVNYLIVCEEGAIPGAPQKKNSLMMTSNAVSMAALYNNIVIEEVDAC
ncbi:2438_t:CDS:2 [Entrophospora sp. SA101]|nr:2438_t:CDS:2 [Entrophospora sp. SA101]